MKRLTGLVVAAALLATAAGVSAEERSLFELRAARANGPSLFGRPLALLTASRQQNPILEPMIVPPAPGPHYYDGGSLHAPTPLQGAVPLYGPSVGSMPGAVELYPCVRYKKERNIHPCAVPMIVAVPDPRPAPHCCPTGCVYVKICVPPGCAPQFSVGRITGRHKYDFGKYGVRIKSKRGWVEVTYKD